MPKDRIDNEQKIVNNERELLLLLLLKVYAKADDIKSSSCICLKFNYKSNLFPLLFFYIESMLITYRGSLNRIFNLFYYENTNYFGNILFVIKHD